MLSCHDWQHVDKLQRINYLIKYLPGVANLAVDALSRMHYPISATPVATIGISTRGLQITGAEKWEQKVCELPVEDMYSCPIVNVLWEEAEVTNEARN